MINCLGLFVQALKEKATAQFSLIEAIRAVDTSFLNKGYENWHSGETCLSSNINYTLNPAVNSSTGAEEQNITRFNGG